MSLLELIQHTIIEKVFAENLSLMVSSGFFTVWEGPAQNPWELFSLAEDLRAEGAALEDWLAARKTFFKAADDFLEGPYEERILEMVAGDEETSAYVGNCFRRPGNSSGVCGTSAPTAPPLTGPSASSARTLPP
jgi:hypothetical protein